MHCKALSSDQGGSVCWSITLLFLSSPSSEYILQRVGHHLQVVQYAGAWQLSTRKGFAGGGAHRGPISGGRVLFRRFAAPLLLARPRWPLGRRPLLSGRALGAPPVHVGCGLCDAFAVGPLHAMSPAPPAVTLNGRKRDGNFTGIQYRVILLISTGN